MTPPRQLLVLMRMKRSRFGLSILQFSTNRFLYPPEISLPTTTPVSYTHLDVYKRQPYVWGAEGAIKTCDHLLFDDDKTENAKGTVIGNGDQIGRAHV